MKLAITFTFFLVSFALLPSLFFAQEGDIKVVVQRVPETPVAGASWTLRLLIDYPQPEEVVVMAPPFPEALFLDRVLIIGRLMGDADDAERWTMAEYRFTVTRPESFSLDAFTVIAPTGRFQTESVTVTARNAAVPRTVLVWENVPKELKVGEEAYLSLKLNKANVASLLPPTQFFSPPLVEGAIIEAQTLSAQDKESSLVLRLKLLPLKAGAIVLAERNLQYENAIYRIPALRIPVSSQLKRETSTSAGMRAADTASLNDAHVQSGHALEHLPFPAFEEPAPKKFFHRLIFALNKKQFSESYQNIFLTAENLWNRGYYADALVFLRRNERDQPAGFLLSGIRQQAEKNCGLENTKGERAGWPGKIFSWPARSYRPGVSSGVSSGVSPDMSPGVSSGVLKETELRRVPNMAGEIVARLKEGQPVRVKNAGKKAKRQSYESGSPPELRWVWIETNDAAGVSGWVQEEAVLYY